MRSSCIVALTVHGTYSSMVLDIVYTDKEEDVLIDTNQEVISYHALDLQPLGILVLREAQCTKLLLSELGLAS